MAFFRGMYQQALPAGREKCYASLRDQEETTETAILRFEMKWLVVVYSGYVSRKEWGRPRRCIDILKSINIFFVFIFL